MNITIRETAEEDLPALFRIRTDPLVVPCQFRLTSRDSIEMWRQQLFGERRDGELRVQSTTILLDDEVVGHIPRTHFRYADLDVCYCGWNLAPPYWGRGIMMRALSQLFDDFFGDQRLDCVVSDCFSNNRRCIRLMEKLGYRPSRIDLLVRVHIALTMRCLHWIRRFQLTAAEWKARTAFTAR